MMECGFEDGSADPVSKGLVDANTDIGFLAEQLHLKAEDGEAPVWLLKKHCNCNKNTCLGRHGWIGNGKCASSEGWRDQWVEVPPG
jgi:hypothetical protein